ncbi:MAG TPA: hypothetical protein VMH87_10085 [Pseudomonadales bacterium]|nr:hypothetical protein [Pseudomonadales bacterium]
MDSLPNISPEKALKRAFWTVKLPSLIVFFVLPGTCMVLAYYHWLSGIWILPAFAISITGSWLVWAVQIPRWRLWAYRHVSDIRLLKELAMRHDYIWQEKSIFTRTEIMSKQVRNELRSLEERDVHNI